MATVDMDHRKVWCAKGPSKQQSAWLVKEINCRLCSVWCAPDSLVHTQTEGNQSLPNGGATAPWPLRAIKEAPRHLYLLPKHTLITSQLRTFAITVFDLLERDLSVFLRCDSVVLICVPSLLLVCVCCCCVVLLFMPLFLSLLRI